MTTSVDILFRELPASAKAIDRVSRSDTKSMASENVDDNSRISTKNSNELKSNDSNENSYDKNDKSFSDYLNDQSTNNNNSDNNNRDNKNIAKENGPDAAANNNGQYSTSENSPLKAETTPVTENGQIQNDTVVKAEGNNENTQPDQNSITNISPDPVNDPAPVNDKVAETLTLMNNRQNIQASTQSIDVGNVKLNEQLSEKAPFKTSEQSVIEKVVVNPLTVPEVANINTALSENETATNSTISQNKSQTNDTGKIKDITTNIIKPSENNPNITPNNVAPLGQDIKTTAEAVKTPIPTVTTADNVPVQNNDINNGKVTSGLVNENGTGQDGFIVKTDENITNIPDIKSASSTLPITDQINGVPSEIKNEQKAVEINIPLAQVASIIKTDTPNPEKLNPATPAADISVEAVKNAATVGNAATVINNKNGGVKSNASIENQKGSKKSAANNASNVASSTQQTNLQNTVKSDIFINVGLAGQKAEQILPQQINLNSQSSLATNNIIAAQEMNIQKSVSQLATAMKTETTTHAKMVSEQISVTITKNIFKGQNNFSIRLNPAELGQVDVRLEFKADGKIHATLMVESEKTLTMLQRDQSVLEKAMQNAGLDLSQNNLNFSLMKQNGQNNGQQFAETNNSNDDDQNQNELAQLSSAQEIRMGYSDQTLDISV